MRTAAGEEAEDVWISYALAAGVPQARAYASALRIMAPGGHPRLVLKAATRRVVGRGDGTRKLSPTRRWFSLARACERTAHPPLRTSAVARRKLPETSCPTGTGDRLFDGGASTQIRREPQLKKLPRYSPTVAMPGSRAMADVSRAANGVVASTLDSPLGLTQTSALLSIARAEPNRPRRRLVCAPPMATIPKTAMALVATIASARTRTRGEPSSSAVSSVAAPPIGRRCRRSKTFTTELNTKGIRRTSAITSVTLPRNASCGLARRITAVIPMQAMPATSRAANQRRAGGLLGESIITSRIGQSTPPIADTAPAPTAKAMLRNETMRMLPTGNAELR